LVLSSEDFLTPWATDVGSCVVSSNAIVAPFGLQTGDQLQFIGTNANRYQTVTGLTNGGTYTFSVWMKVSSGTASVSIGNINAGVSVAQTVTTDWQRFSVTQTASATTRYPSIIATNTTVFVWGAQLEAGSSATSYVATPLTFTSRASSATYLGPNGYITSASTNVARNQTNSVGTTNLLLESAASNLFKYTDDFANAFWQQSNASIAVNQIQSPDGLTFADKLVEASGTGLYPQLNIPSVAVSNSTAYTFSVYAKAGERAFIRLLTDAAGIGGQGASAWFNLSTGVVVSQTTGVTATIQDVGGGWYRCIMTRTSAFTIMFCQFLIGPDATANAYTGNGTSGLYLWGAQVETGSTATSYIPSVETFSGRSSSGTYYNSSGVLSTATSGTSRTTYNPALLGAGGKLLLEPAATNLMLYSEQFDNGNWTKNAASVTANSTTAPDGNSTADTLVPNTTNTWHVAQQSVSSATSVLTVSVYAKANGYNYIVLALSDGTANGAGINFNLSSGTSGSSVTVGASGWTAGSSTIQAVGNGWYRCSATITTTGSTKIIQIYATDVDYSTWGFTYAGNGSSGVYLWGAQMETSSGATSYIATTSSTVTRAADTSTSAAQSRSADVYSASTVTRAADAASMTGTNYTSWFTANAGTFYADFVSTLTGTTPDYPYIISGNSTGNYAAFMYMGPASNPRITYGVYSANGGGTVAGSTVTNNALMRVASSYDSSGKSISTNGVTNTSTSSPVSYLVVDGIYFATAKYQTASNFNGTFKKIAFYPQRLTDAQLSGLTT
jgi:hypothetical protein